MKATDYKSWNNKNFVWWSNKYPHFIHNFTWKTFMRYICLYKRHFEAEHVRLVPAATFITIQLRKLYILFSAKQSLLFLFYFKTIFLPLWIWIRYVLVHDVLLCQEPRWLRLSKAHTLTCIKYCNNMLFWYRFSVHFVLLLLIAFKLLPFDICNISFLW